MLLTEPDVLLLDEPTNHLDLKSIAWLEDYLRTYRGAVLLISHDRYFMDHVCDRMCELLLGATECYDGNYSAYMVQRTERFEIRMKAYELQQKEIARQEAIIARYRQFNREKSIRLAESREKRLEKVERLEKPKDESAIHFHFDVRRRTGDDVLMIDDMGVEPLMENITIVQWFNLINERQLRGKGTVISTNLNVEELRRRYTERITSRLLDGKQCMLLQFLGDDVRRNKA